MGRARVVDDAAEFILATYASLKGEELIKRAIDRLPYTDDFEVLFVEVNDQYPDLTRNDIWCKLCNQRKKGMGDTRIRVRGEDKISLTQVRILKALSRSPYGLTADDISESADAPKHLTSIVGPTWTEDNREVEQKIGKRTLMGRGMVSVFHSQSDINGKDVVYYRITILGEKALQALSKWKPVTTKSPVKVAELYDDSGSGDMDE